jgi:hypothetical protein
MTNLQTLLEQNGITKAVLIDDTFDDVPQPDELVSEDWSIFFDDLTEDDRVRLSELYPEFKSFDVSTLQRSQEFISILWTNRDNLAIDAINTLFQEYEAGNMAERNKLGKIVRVLENVGLKCTTVGRDFGSEADGANLIVVDLFLEPQILDWSGGPRNRDIESAIQRVRRLIVDRPNDPPLIILTSSSPRLSEKKNDFRDEAGLLSSIFRVSSKSELVKDGTLELILSRLADHYEDSKRIARFLNAWNEGLDRTRTKFLERLRRLDLPDLAQIRTLLLNHEGERLGDYLLDVADRILQHEIEGDSKTIIAAQELSQINLDKYPASHLAGTPDFQDFVCSMMFVHQDRLSLPEANGMLQLRFGDVLCQKENDEDVFGDNAWLVITPACDLARSGTNYIMLLPGRLQEFTPRDWSYKDRPVRTPIIILNGQRKWIKWNLREVLTRHRNDLNKSLLPSQGRCLIRVARLREVYALELQQKVLTWIGRIGLPANMPASFPVAISLYYADTDSKARNLHIGGSDSAACYVGRGEDSRQEVHHLVLTEETCDQIRQAVQNLSEDDVHPLAKKNLKAAKKDLRFFMQFERGDVKISSDKPSKDPNPITSRDNTAVYATIKRKTGLKEGVSLTGYDRKAAIIIDVTDISGEYDPQEGD